MAAAEQEASVREAMRIVEQELWANEQMLADAARTGMFWSTTRSLTQDAWHAYRQTLSRLLGLADWQTLNAAYEAVNDLELRLRERAVETRPENAAQAITSAILDVHGRRVRDDDRLELRWRAVRRASWMLRATLDEGEKVTVALDEDERLAAELWPQSRSLA